jgi:transcriptional regulator of heat shock response
MGIISNIIESNRRRDQRIAEIQESTRKEIERINAHYAEKEKRLQEHHDKFMKMLDDPNISGDQIMDLISEYSKEQEAI